MEIVSIETKTFEEMEQAFLAFRQKLQNLCNRHPQKKMDEWLDNQEVCGILNISPRTLQSLRSNGTLAYTQVERRSYYRKQDVIKLLEMAGVKPSKTIQP